MTEPAPAILVRRLSKSFGRRTVLRQIDWQVAEGQSVAVTGANGSGKSTLLACLASVVRPTSGEVRWFGHPAAGDPAARRLVGMVAHENRLYPHLTLRENLVFAARMYGVAWPQRRADQWLEAPAWQPTPIACRRRSPGNAAAGGRGAGPDPRPADPALGRAVGRPGRRRHRMARRPPAGVAGPGQNPVPGPARRGEGPRNWPHTMVELPRRDASSLRRLRRRREAGNPQAESGPAQHRESLEMQTPMAARLWWILQKDLVSECRARRVWPAMLLLGIVVAFDVCRPDGPAPRRAAARGRRPALAGDFLRRHAGHGPQFRLGARGRLLGWSSAFPGFLGTPSTWQSSR